MKNKKPRPVQSKLPVNSSDCEEKGSTPPTP